MCMEFFKKKMKKMDVWDISMVKLGAMSFGLFLGAYVPMLSEYMYIWLGLAILFAIRPFYRVYMK